jgi:ribonucleoside-diphosphate reductase alpha chain
MKLTENAIAVLEKRYLIRDETGAPTETPIALFRRVASAIAEGDRFFDPQCDTDALTQRFYDVMTNLEFLPNSPTLMNAGRPLGQLSACFVLPVGDSMEEIFDAIKHAALIHKSGGGTGFSFSRLRAKGAPVNSTGGVASGPVSFMKVFNAATEAVKQGGTRRGANMGILRVDHPDILEFISCKNALGEITNFNISVGLTEAFMEAAEDGREYDLVDPSSRKVMGTLNAGDVFDTIVDSAWRTGEPGIVFLDRLNRDNVTPTLGEIEATNPCGEQPLLPYESCNLGSINLAQHLVEQNGIYQMDWEKLKETTRTAVHFLDNVIEVNAYPLPEIERVTKLTRKIGLGVMGFADVLLRLNLPYNSEEGVALAKEIMSLIHDTGVAESQALAKVRGAFPLFAESTWKNGPAMRNATITTIAPTGTLSILSGVSGGIEPVFAYAYIRNVMDNTHLVETNHILKERLTEAGLYDESLMSQVVEQGSVAHIDGIPEEIKQVFVCAHDVSPQWHVKMQAAFQMYTDNAVSKTVNFPTAATREDVASVFRLAFQSGCKGVTIYRDGSRDNQVLNIGAVGSDGEPGCLDCNGMEHTSDTLSSIAPRPRPDITTGFTEKVKIGCGNLYITVNYDDKGICEVFTNTGRAGGCPSQSEATARLISIALRSGIQSEAIVEQLKGIRCPSTIRQPGMKVTSCPDAIGKVIEKVQTYSSAAQVSVPAASSEIQDVAPQEMEAPRYCPDCGSPLEHEGNCVCCRSCGYSKCG